MGVKSTYEIDRETAMEVIDAKLHECTDNELALILENFNYSEFRNYIVVEQLGTPDNRQITSLEDFTSKIV